MHEAVVGEILTRLQSGELNLQQADIRLMEESQNSQAAALGHVLEYAWDTAGQKTASRDIWKTASGRRPTYCMQHELLNANHTPVSPELPQQEARCPSDRLPIDDTASRNVRGVDFSALLNRMMMLRCRQSAIPVSIR